MKLNRATPPTHPDMAEKLDLRAFRAVRNHHFRWAHAVSLPQLIVLATVVDFCQSQKLEEGMTLGALANLLRVTPAAVSVMVTRMVRDGFLQRERIVEDRRAIAISATAAGLRVLKPIS